MASKVINPTAEDLIALKNLVWFNTYMRGPSEQFSGSAILPLVQQQGRHNKCTGGNKQALLGVIPYKKR